VKEIKLTAKQLFDLFANRIDVYTLSQSNGDCLPVKKKLTVKDFEKHLLGEFTINVYNLEKDNLVKWGAVDLDSKKDPKGLLKPANIVYNGFKGFPRMLEWSGRKGYHVWIFFNPREPAGYVRQLMWSRVRRLKLGIPVEVFPKQTHITEFKKFGSTLKVPCGKHMVSGDFSRVLKMDLVGLSREASKKVVNRKI